jgi:hypothetical protein
MGTRIHRSPSWHTSSVSLPSSRGHPNNSSTISFARTDPDYKRKLLRESFLNSCLTWMK